MITPTTIFNRCNTVFFGPPKSSNPFLSWAGGGDDDGGSGGTKRSFNMAVTMSHEKYCQLKEELSSSSSDSEDDEDDNFHYGFEYIKLLPEPEGGTSKKPRAQKVMADIDETSIMQPYINAKECNCSTCLASYNNEISKWVAYYNENKPTPLMTMLKTHEQKEHINDDCKRLVSIFDQFDNGQYRKPNQEAATSSSSTSVKSKTGTLPSKVDKSTIPDHVMYISRASRIGDNSASMHFFWMTVDNLPDFGSLSGNKLGGVEYDYTKQVYDDDGTGLFLGGIEYDGELVGGSKMNVFLISKCIEFEEMGYECWKVIDGKLQKLKIVNDKNEKYHKDTNSMRSFLYHRFNDLFKDDTTKRNKIILKAKQVQQQQVQKEIARIEGLDGLGTLDPHYVPYYEQSKEERKSKDGNVTKDEVSRFEAQFTMVKSSQEGRKVEEVTREGRKVEEVTREGRKVEEVTREGRKVEKVTRRTSEHKPIPIAIMDNCNVFELLLKIEQDLTSSSESQAMTYDHLEKELSQYGIPMELLCSPEYKTLSYPGRWNNACSQKLEMLGSITLSYIKYFSLGCYNYCGRGVDDVTSYHQLRKLHVDHLINWFPKWVNLTEATLRGPREVIMEALKGRIVCSHCHYGGRESDIRDYYERLQVPNTLRYSRDIYGDKHRTVTEIFDIKEVASLRLDLEERKAFGQVRAGNGIITYQTVQVVLWNHLRIYLPDLRKGDDSLIEMGGRNDKLCMKMFRELIKMLAVKCPGNGECFLNLRALTRSGVELNHKKPSKKLMTPSLLFEYSNLTRFVDELKLGDLDSISTGCHGEVTAYQRDRAKKPSWYDGN